VGAPPPRRVLHLADQLLEDVLEEEHRDGVAVGAPHLRQVAAGAAHHGERVLEIGVLLHRHHVVDALGGQRLGELRCGVGTVRGAQDVLEVHVADRHPVAVDDHVAREPVAGHGLLDVVRRGRLRQRHQVAQRHRDVAGLLVGELHGGRHRARRVVEDPLTARLIHDGRHLVEREGRCGLVLGLDAEQPQDAVRRGVEHPDHRHEHLRHPHQRRGEHQHRPVGDREGEVLRHHLAEHHVQERHQHEGDRERHRVDHGIRPSDGVHRHREQVVDRRLGHVQDQQRADRDAELRGREHERRVLHRVQSGLRRTRSLLGARLDLRAARGDDGELGADEEGVAEQQHHEPDDPRPVAHRVASSSPASAVGT
jgi:hypothetical protein